MAMGSLVISTLPRTQDFSTLKQNEDNRGIVNQMNLHEQHVKTVEQHIKQVRHGDNTDLNNEKFDAKEKGKNEYYSDGVKKKNKKKSEDRVVNKNYQGFDMKV